MQSIPTLRLSYGHLLLKALERHGSGWDAILLCVGADPRSGNDLDRLEGEVRARLEACQEALQG